MKIFCMAWAKPSELFFISYQNGHQIREELLKYMHPESAYFAPHLCCKGRMFIVFFLNTQMHATRVSLFCFALVLYG